MSARHKSQRRRPLPGSLSWRAIGATVASTAALTLILALHGFFPQLSQDSLMALRGPGMIECLHRQGLSSLTSWCMDVGQPLGAPIVNGLAETYLGWLLSYLPSFDAWDAHQVSGALIDAIALAAGFLLMRRWGASWWVSLFVPTLYLTSLSVLQLNGSLYTFAGFILLPLVVLLALKLLDALSREPRKMTPLLGMPPLALLLVFTDGYVFFAANLLIGVLGLRWALREPRSRGIRLRAAAAWAASNIGATAVYMLYVPGPPQPLPVGLGAFRYLGLDVATLVIPSPRLWWASQIGVTTDLPLWGDGTNVAYNYIGISTLAFAAWFAVRASRRLESSSGSEVRYLLAASLVALMFSFGPSLKVYDVATPIDPIWDVPVESTTLALPTEWVYERVPGFDQLRATYRWFVATRFVLYVAAGLAISVQWQRGSRNSKLAAISMACVLAVETTANIPSQIEDRLASTAHVDAIRNEVIPDLQLLVAPGEQILVLPTNNDFLADAVFPFLPASSFNTGVDRNYLLSRATWPASVESAAAGFGTLESGDLICRTLATDTDAVLLPYFSYYGGALDWPPPDTEFGEMKARAEWIAGDPRFVAVSGEWATILRPGPECERITE